MTQWLPVPAGTSASSGPILLYWIENGVGANPSCSSAPRQAYHKFHLVPFGEFVPPGFGWVLRVVQIPLTDFSRGGPEQRPLEVAGQRVAVNICYEDAFGDEIARRLPEATLLVNVSIMLGVFLLTLWLYRVPIGLSLFQAVQLIFVELLVVTAIALFFSTFTSSTLSAILTLGCYIIGHLTADLKGVAANSENEAATAIVTVLYYLCPNLEMFNVKGQAAVGIPVAPEYLMLASLYGLVYAAMMTTGACVIFHRRDF